MNEEPFLTYAINASRPIYFSWRLKLPAVVSRARPDAALAFGVPSMTLCKHVTSVTP